MDVALCNVAHYSNSRVDASILNENTYVGVDNLLQDRQGKEKSSYVPSNGKCTEFNSGDVLIGNIRPYLKKIWLADCNGGTNGDVLVIEPNTDVITPKYLYFVLASDEFFAYDMQNAKGAKMPRGNKDAVMKFEFSLPHLEKQKEIVEKLDRFDKLVNDISVGLPAEIKARQQQYEYYRNKLLSFKHKAE